MKDSSPHLAHIFLYCNVISCFFLPFPALLRFSCLLCRTVDYGLSFFPFVLTVCFLFPFHLLSLSLSMMPLLHYHSTFSFPLPHTKSLLLSPVLSPHLHTQGLRLLIKDTKQRVIMLLQSQVWHRLPTLSSGFWLSKGYESFFTSPFSLLLWKRERACSCLPLFFLHTHSPTGLFWLVHNQSDALSYSASSQPDFFQFLSRNPGSKEKAEQRN